MYVASCSGLTYMGVKPNKKGGATISVLKRGGWKLSFHIAKVLAQWAPCLQCNGIQVPVAVYMLLLYDMMLSLRSLVLRSYRPVMLTRPGIYGFWCIGCLNLGTTRKEG